jgi:hypothetical protein
VQVCAIYMIYKTGPMEIIPGTPRMETEWPAHPHRKCSGGWFNSTQPMNTCRTSKTTLAVSGYASLCQKSAMSAHPITTVRSRCKCHRHSWCVTDLPPLLSLLDTSLKISIITGCFFQCFPHCKPKTTFKTAAILRGKK